MNSERLVREGRAWLFPDANINTDLIMPQIAFNKPPEEQLRYVFAANRPGWVDLVRPGDVLVGGPNFGTGSSRPGALLLKRLGISALVAESINGLFYRNCINYALPAIECQGVCQLVSEGQVLRVDFDGGVVENVSAGKKLTCRRMPEFLRAVVQAGGIIPRLRAEGYLS